MAADFGNISSLCIVYSLLTLFSLVIFGCPVHCEMFSRMNKIFYSIRFTADHIFLGMSKADTLFEEYSIRS